MGLLDAFFGRALDDYITYAVVIVVFVTALALKGFDISSVTGALQDLGKFIIGFGAGASGVYVLYKTQRSRTPSDDVLGVIVGLGLLGFAGYVMFGQSIMGFMDSAKGFMTGILPYVVGGAVALSGAKLADSRSKFQSILGIVLIILGAVMIGIKLTGW